MSVKPSIAWLIPSLIEGSGGIREIFNKINALIARGYECHAYVHQKDDDSTVADQIDCYYGGSPAVIHAGWDLKADYDLVFATAWWSAKVAAATFSRKAYLIQDFEAYFNPSGDGFLMAERSYQLGLDPVALGRWLPAMLAARYNSKVRYFDFCADTDKYKAIPGAKREDPSVCFIFQPEKPRRCAAIGLKALELLKAEMPEVKIYLYGANTKAEATFEHENLGILQLADINALYNRTSVGLCISSSNPSRIPFEMMAAGLPVVDIWRENNLYDFPEGGVLLADPTPQALCAALKSLLQDPARRQSLSAFGPGYMAERPMAREYGQFVDAVDRIFEGSFYQDVPPPPQPIYRAAPVTSTSGITL